MVVSRTVLESPAILRHPNRAPSLMQTPWLWVSRLPSPKSMNAAWMILWACTLVRVLVSLVDAYLQNPPAPGW